MAYLVPRRHRGPGGVAGLDVALVATALRSTSAGTIDTSPLTSASADPSLSSASAGSATAAGKPSPTTGAPSASAPLQMMLAALDHTHALRVGAGSCSAGGATLATTVDGGKTWAKGEAKLRRIVRVRPTGNRAAFIIGADASCAAELRNTSDAGTTWTPAGSVALAWYRDPRSTGVVRAPGSLTSRPWGTSVVLDLAVLTTRTARVLCADGLLRSTTDSGSRWVTAGRADGAVALAVPAAKPADTYVARLGAPGCAGVQILRVRPQVVVSCVPGSVPWEPGQIAISLIDGGGWLAIGNATMRSADNLATWRTS